MSFQHSDLDHEAYEYWHLATQLSAFAVLMISLYPIFYFCSEDW